MKPLAPSKSLPVPETSADFPGVVHVDATVRRREKMKERASGNTPSAAPPQREIIPAPAPVVVAEPQPVAPAPVTSQPPSNLPSGAELEKFLVEFVVEQTGYPEEMVELDADLEADLGIDSIKKAQLFGELAEKFDIQVQGVEDLSLDDFPTLREVQNFLENNVGRNSDSVPPTNESTSAAPSAAIESTPATAPSVAAPVATPEPQVAAPSVSISTPAQPSLPGGAELEKFLIEFVVEQTGYPEEMVELDADLEADLGIDSIKKAQLFGELAEQFGISPQAEDTGDLSLDDFTTLRHVMTFLQDLSPQAESTPAEPAPEPPAPITEPVPEPVSVTAPSPNGHHVEPASAGVDMSPDELESYLINFVVEQTGYPEEMVELDADLEADLGIDSIKKAQLFGELAEKFDIGAQVQDTENLSLDDFPTLRHVSEFLLGAAV